MKFLLLACLALGIASVAQALESHNPVPATMTFCSPAGDYIGGGQSFTYTDANAFFTPSAPDNGGTGVMISVEGDTWWDLTFVAGRGDAFQVGTYQNAQRYPFQNPTGPGLDVSGDGRGCNELSGSFNVLELTYDKTGAIQNLAIDFEQSCEKSMPALRGAIRINSTVPASVKCR